MFSRARAFGLRGGRGARKRRKWKKTQTLRAEMHETPARQLPGKRIFTVQTVPEIDTRIVHAPCPTNTSNLATDRRSDAKTVWSGAPFAGPR